MLGYIETHIVNHCNLKCRGCSHFSGLAKEYYKPLGDFEREMKALSEKEDIRTIRIMGGEPLLHPQWFNFLLVARAYFPNSQVVLVTNGILLSKLREYIDALNENQITVCLSEYHLKLKDRDILGKLKYREIHEKGNLYNISLDLNGKQDINEAYKYCDLARYGWYFFKDGRLYNCCIFANIDIFIEKFNADIQYDIDDISIDVATHTADEIEKFLTTPHKACKYCDTRKRMQTHIRHGISKEVIEEWI